MNMTVNQAIETGTVFSAGQLAGSTQGGEGVAFTLPIEIVSEANRRDHWAAKYRRAKRQKRAAHLGTLKHAIELRNRVRADVGVRLVVTLVRLMRPRQRRFDGDNLQSGFKAVRDGVAAGINIDDGSDRLEWRYGQEPAEGKRAGVRVVITQTDF